MKPTKEEYDLMQESSQHFNESYEHFCRRMQQQEAHNAAGRMQCKYALQRIAAYMKNGKPGLLWFITDHTGKFVAFFKKTDADEFADSTKEYVKNNTYEKWQYIPLNKKKAPTIDVC